MLNIQRIKIDRSKNQEYYEILEKANYYVDRWNKLNDEIINVSIPKYYLRKTKKRIIFVRDKALDLNNEFHKWLKEINGFIVNPRINVENSQNPDLTFLHFKELLIRRVEDVKGYFKFQKFCINPHNLRYMSQLQTK